MHKQIRTIFFKANEYNTRLRLESSSLKHHLSKKNLIDGVTCFVGRDETTKHFLKECPNYQDLRGHTLSDVCHFF